MKNPFISLIGNWLYIDRTHGFKLVVTGKNSWYHFFGFGKTKK